MEKILPAKLCKWIEKLISHPASQLKTRKNCEEIICFMPAGSQICRSFKEHQTRSCASQKFMFPRELVNSVCPWELVSFDPRHMTHSLPICKHICVGRYNIACRTGVIFAYLREQGRKRGEREARVACVGRFAKNPACRHTIVQALPPPDTP